MGILMYCTVFTLTTSMCICNSKQYYWIDSWKAYSPCFHIIRGSLIKWLKCYCRYNLQLVLVDDGGHLSDRPFNLVKFLSRSLQLNKVSRKKRKYRYLPHRDIIQNIILISPAEVFQNIQHTSKMKTSSLSWWKKRALLFRPHSSKRHLWWQ